VTDAEASLLRRVEDLEHAVRQGAGRAALAQAGDDFRVDCSKSECGDNLAILDAATATIRFGYGKSVAYLPAAARIVLTCKRCKRCNVVEHGQIIGYVDPLVVARDWAPGDPMPIGLRKFAM